MTSQEFRNYLAAGIVCNTLWPGVEEKPKTLVGYSYNGVVLSDLPELDGTDKNYYQYKTIAFGADYAVLYLTRTKLINNNGLAFDEWGNTFHCYKATMKENNTIVENPEIIGLVGMNAIIGSGYWANYDILNTDDTVYLPVSEPVPVYE